MMQLSTFLSPATGPERAWCRFMHAAVYMRRSEHLLNDALLHHTFDIANVEVNERYRGRSEFAKLVQAIAAHTPTGHYIYVENVLHGRFADYFRRNGWTESAHNHGLGNTPCFYTLPTCHVYGYL